MFQSIFENLNKKYLLEGIFGLAALLLGLLQILAHPYSLATDDAIAYLDIGDSYLRGEWKSAINGYWSPFYSWLLGLTMAVLRPSAYWEFFSVKIANFLIYIFAIFCYRFFLNELIYYYKKRVDDSSPQTCYRIPEWVWLVSGYTLFLWTTLRYTPLYCDTPDLITTALVYIASGILLRLNTRSQTWLSFAALGAALGFAYLSKAVMFPLSFTLLAVGAFSGGNLKTSFPRILLALLIFTIIAGPFITALSVKKGYLTFGDTGKLNYAWYVTGGVQSHRYWEGKEPGWGTPKNPLRKIFEEPKVFEFATPINGTYPLWHDPSYWYEGLAFRFKPVRQFTAFLDNIYFFSTVFLGSLIFGYVTLLYAGGRPWLSVRALAGNWPLIIPAVAGLGVYAIGTNVESAWSGELQPSTRLIAPFVVLLFAGVFSSLRLYNSKDSERLIAGITFATLGVISTELYLQGSRDFLNIFLNGPGRHVNWEVANSLQHMGIQPGEKVAIIGRYIYPHYYWARLARVMIVAEVINEKDFWLADADIRDQVLKAVQKTGASAIIQKRGFEIPNSALLSGWQAIGSTGYYVYLFHPE